MLEIQLTEQSLDSAFTVEGSILDAIVSDEQLKYKRLLGFENGNGNRHHVLDFWKSKYAKPSTYFTGESLLEVYASVLLAGRNTRRNQAQSLADFAAYVRCSLSMEQSHRAAGDHHDYEQQMRVMSYASIEGDWNILRCRQEIAPEIVPALPRRKGTWALGQTYWK